MSLPIDRDFLTHAVIIGAVCCGGWMMLVQPRAEELRDIEAAIEASYSGGIQLTPEAVEKAAENRSIVLERVLEIERANRLAGDTSRLYSSITELAQKNGVILQRLQPGELNAKDKDKRNAAVIDLTVEGDYQEVAEFLAAMEDLPGFLRPNTLSLSAAGRSSNEVSARFQCDALRFELPEILAAMKESVDE